MCIKKGVSTRRTVPFSSPPSFRNLLVKGCLLLLSFSSPDASAQDDVENLLFRASLLFPSFSVEKRIGFSQTIHASLQARLMVLSITKDYIAFNNSGTVSTSTDHTFKFFIDPAVTLQYRYYYNLGKRSNDGKNTLFNSANYLAPLYSLSYSKMPMPGIYSSAPGLLPNRYSFRDMEITANRRPLHFLGALWGITRTFDRFYIDANIGPVYLFSTSDYTITTTDTQGSKVTDYLKKQKEGNVILFGEFFLGIYL